LKLEQIRHTLTGTGAPKPRANPWPEKGEDASTTKQKLRVLLDRLKEKLQE
jgi:hypothetical protein